MITFSCDLCGKHRSEPNSWYKKRQAHYCSRLCANRANSQKRATGLTRKEYEKQYWSKPENKERRKNLAEENRKLRTLLMGESYKRMMLARAKARADKCNVPFSLIVGDIVIPEKCPALGVALTPNVGRRGGNDFSPSIDRIVPHLGYVKGNICIISNLANRIKSNATFEQLALVLQWAASFQHGNHPE